MTTWDPSASFSTEVLYMVNLYEPLLYVNPPGSPEQFRPALAESWEVSSDGLEWTFHLRKGVKFHDGEPLTAQAVQQSIQRTIDLGLGAAFIWSPVDTIEAVDDYTVRFHLKYAAALDLIAASSNGAWIMSPKAIAAAAADPQYFE
ncbi:MAG: ABC transporter substrate-binding protein, partial [Bryobacteraceae bacterium]